MKTIRALLENYVLICTLSSWATAQVCKFLLTYFLNHEIRLERLSGAGGMPSAHSATVTALVISCARFEGIGSTFFAIAVALAAIVIIATSTAVKIVLFIVPCLLVDRFLVILCCKVTNK